jgi:hypothetical protein
MSNLIKMVENLYKEGKHQIDNFTLKGQNRSQNNNNINYNNQSTNKNITEKNGK